MTDETTSCPTCGQGILDSKVITDSPNGEHIENRHYSCGHKYEKIEISANISVEANLKKMRSRGGDKIGDKKREFEIEERYKNNDRDRSGAATVEFVYINHRANPTSAFHIVKYVESNELKHIHCKTCDSTWQHSSGSSLESHFLLEHIPDVEYIGSLKIECLKCNAKYER